MARVAMHTYRALECSSPGPQRQCHESDVVLLLIPIPTLSQAASLLHLLLFLKGPSSVKAVRL